MSSGRTQATPETTPSQTDSERAPKSAESLPTTQFAPGTLAFRRCNVSSDPLLSLRPIICGSSWTRRRTVSELSGVVKPGRS